MTVKVTCDNDGAKLELGNEALENWLTIGFRDGSGPRYDACSLRCAQEIVSVGAPLDDTFRRMAAVAEGNGPA